jgi:cytochrome P450 PksS
LPDGQTAVLVTRYDDVVSVLRDERFCKDRVNALTPGQLRKQPWMPSFFKPLLHNMLDTDRPNHTRLKGLVQKAFTPQRVLELRGRIESLADELLESIGERHRFDLIGDFALPLPSTVIAEMLGVPVEDRHKFHRWSNALVSSSGSTWETLRIVPPVWSFLRYVRKLIAQRRRSPQSDMITALVEARESGDQLSEDELVAMIFLLLVAGHETTVNLIGNGILALLEHPAQLQLLREEPTRIETAVEELLRFASPLDTATERYTAEPVELAGVRLPRGSLVLAGISSANRDESQFPRGDEMDITRDPNRHLSFGLGIHFCLGAPLARLEGQIAIDKLLNRFPDLQLAVPSSSLTWRRGMVLRGMVSLPLERG